MKTNRIILTSLLGLAAAGALTAAGPAMTEPSVEVVFQEPEKFTDLKDRYFNDRLRDTTYLEQLREHIESRAKHYVAPDQKLSVMITDVDMAGEFEPWRGPRADDIRIIKDIYPPRIKMSFRVTDANGQVVKEGERDLRDLGFMAGIGINRNDTLRYEKELLDGWFRSEFQRVKKS